MPIRISINIKKTKKGKNKDERLLDHPTTPLRKMSLSNIPYGKPSLVRVQQIYSWQIMFGSMDSHKTSRWIVDHNSSLISSNISSNSLETQRSGPQCYTRRLMLKLNESIKSSNNISSATKKKVWHNSTSDQTLYLKISEALAIVS